MSSFNLPMTPQQLSSLLPEGTNPKELTQILGRIIQDRKQHNRLRNYAPYARQREFHNAGATHRVRALIAANQVGKCCTATTLIDTVAGRIAIKDLPHGDFEVWAWNGQERVKARAFGLFRKPGWHECYRIEMADGQWVEAADFHRVLVGGGVWAFVHQLASLPNLQASSSARVPSIHASNAPHWFETLGGCLARCFADYRRYGAQLLRAIDSAPAFFPSPSDARQPAFAWFDAGDRANTRTNNRRPECGPLSNPDAVLRFLAQSAAFLSQSADTSARRWFDRCQAILRLSIAAVFQPRSSDAAGPRAHDTKPSSLTPVCIDGNQIISIKPIGRHRVYDFTVEQYHNYVAGGLVHHNTLSAGAEMAIHLTGRYPDWWQGRVFNTPISAWASGVTGESTRDNPQKILYGPLGQPGTGMIPKNAIKDASPRRGLADALDTMLVKWGGGGDIQAGTSDLGFKSNDQGREKWQGPTKHVVWPDEEHDEDVFNEAMTRLNVHQGLMMCTFTPLKGMTSIVRRFLINPPDSWFSVSMTIDDADHYSAEQRAEIIAGYAPHEREARAKGIPTMGSGRVFPIEEEFITCDAFEIPSHWPQLGGIDFGWDHPSAGVKVAWDRDADVIYVTHATRAREATPLLFASMVKPWGEWLPWAWPHDGLQHDKGSGIQLAQQYRQQGMRMMADRATFEDGSNGVEAGLMEMYDRMKTGRLKVFRHLNDWLEEFRMYHRKDGLVVKEMDDLMSATRYAIMMKRAAQTKMRKVAPIVREYQGADAWMG